MTSTNQVFNLNIFLHDEHVGVLRRKPNDRYEFFFTESYKERENRPVLSLRMLGPSGEAVPPKSTAVKLPPFFSNLLPEGSYREMVADLVGVSREQEFFLLWTLGLDMAGAVTARSADFDDVPEDLRHAVDERYRLRMAIAGAQKKLFANEVPLAELGQKVTFRAAYKGDSNWIAKLPPERFPNAVENEFSMMRFAAIAGIETPEVLTLKAGELDNLPPGLDEDSGAFLIRRYDRREDGSKVHQEDFAQIFGQFPEDKYGGYSYASIAKAVHRFAGEEQLREFIRRLVFTVFIGNGDAHLKNWSFLYPDGSAPVLAPAYDYLSTLAYLPKDMLGLSIGSTKRFSKVDADQFERLAKRASLPVPMVLDEAAAMTEKLRDLWPVFSRENDIPEDIRQQIDAHIDTVPLFETRVHGRGFTFD